jgi:Ca2+-dependent lipid-binding protein
VEVVGAVDIPAADFKTSDPYLRLSVTPGFNNQGKRTKAIESTLAPVWNESFTFVFGKIDGVAIQVVMWDVDEQDGDNKLSTLTIPLSDFSAKIQDFQAREYQMTPWKKYDKGGVLSVRVKLICETPGVVGGLEG